MGSSPVPPAHHPEGYKYFYMMDRDSQLIYEARYMESDEQLPLPGHTLTPHHELELRSVISQLLPIIQRMYQDREPLYVREKLIETITDAGYKIKDQHISIINQKLGIASDGD